MNLSCKLFGHKFYTEEFILDGGFEVGVSGLPRATGSFIKREKPYCTRCGLDRSTLNKKIDNKDTSKN
jgi:hypothetical protein